MTKYSKELLDAALISCLVFSCLFHPASASLGLFVFLSFQIADRYLKSNISDQDRRDLETVKAELAKLKKLQQAGELGKAFGAR